MCIQKTKFQSLYNSNNILASPNNLLIESIADVEDQELTRPIGLPAVIWREYIFCCSSYDRTEQPKTVLPKRDKPE